MLSAKSIIIGTRTSQLALAQAYEIKNTIIGSSKNYFENPNLIKIEGFKTTGDMFLSEKLTDINSKGLFTKEIEDALIEKKISLAVHSMKDMPAKHPKGVGIAAFTKRENPRDAFISLNYKSIEDLPKNSTIGTSSTRRSALILKIRPDLKIVNFRGNINTRLKKMENGEVDATILAVSGLRRINCERYISSIISTSQMLPPVGQGAIGVQCRLDDEFSLEISKLINHCETEICVKSERSFLKEVNGSCKTPIAAYCKVSNDNYLILRCLIAHPDGKEIFETSRKGLLSDGEMMGKDAGIELKTKAKHILKMFN